MIEAEEYYMSVERDSWHWLDSSEKLKFSSEVIYKELHSLFEILRTERTFKDEEKIMALWSSYYLLVGHSFENLIKGLSIENNRSAKNFKEIFKKWGNNGHQISKIAEDNIPLLTKDEISIIEKLETYIIWAGRFHLPKDFDIYTKERGNLYYYSEDYDTINILYERTKEILEIAYAKNENKKSPPEFTEQGY
jgi:hypothetical protein